MKPLQNDIILFFNVNKMIMSEIWVLFSIRVDSTRNLRITSKLVENLANYANNADLKLSNETNF